jgi:energy-coupling factor transport system substrate-specific component
MSDSKISVKNVAFLGVSLAILEASKLALDFLPNVEMVTLLFIVYTIFFGRNTILVAIGFTAIECFLKGFNIWSLMYLYIWPLLIMIVFYANRHKAGYVFYCILSGLFGLFFGMFCAIPNLFIGGWNMAVTWWIAGIPYDAIHCVSNFAMCLFLFKPLCAIMRKVTSEQVT